MSFTGSYKIDVIATKTGEPTVTDFFMIDITNSAPVFTSNLAISLEVGVLNLWNEILPIIFDINNDPVSMTLNSPPSFVTLVSTTTLKIDPTSFAHIGTYIISISLSDPRDYTTYTLDLTVFNNPPVFAMELPDEINVKLNDNFVYDLPSMSDPESNPITVSITSTDLKIYSFVTIAANQLSLTINPVDFKLFSIGTFPLTIKLCDGEPLCTEYNTVIILTNSLP
jgi:hypothetical protein